MHHTRRTRLGPEVVLLCLLSAAAVLPEPASAQTVTRGGMQQSTFEDQRPAGWVFTPSLATGGTWDDNLLLGDPNDDLLRDYATPVSPGLSLNYRGRRTDFATAYDGSFLMYRQLGELNSATQGFGTRLQFRPSARVTLGGQGNYTSAPTTDSLDLGGVPFYRIGTETTSGGGTMDAVLGPRLSLRAAYTLSSVSFDRDDRLETPLQGGYAHEGRLAVTRAFSSRLTLGARYELRRAVLADGDDEFNIQSGSLTVERRMSPTMSASGFAGVAVLGAGLRHDTHVGPTIGAALTRRTRLAVMSVAYQRTFIPSWGFGGTSQNEELLVGVRVPLARNRAYLAGDATWMDADSFEAEIPSIQSVWLGVTLGYRATRWLNVETFYNGIGQNTSEPGGDRRRNIAGFRLLATRPMKLR